MRSSDPGWTVASRAVVVTAAALLLLGGCYSHPTQPDRAGEPAGLVVQTSVAGTPIAALAVEVAAADIPVPLVFNLTLADGVASGTLRVPAGSQRRFTARAFDAAGVETHRGGRNAAVRAGENPPLSLVLTPLSGGQPLELTIGSYQLLVSPAAARLAVGDKLRLTVEVRDAEGGPVDALVQWASLDPTIATVDAAGVVSARAPGEARIVAVHGGVGAAAHLTVERP